MSENPSVKVWRFDSAPEEFKALSPHGGDEDWLAYIPPSLVDDYYGWMDCAGQAFGWCDISRHTLADGAEVRIGAHA